MLDPLDLSVDGDPTEIGRTERLCLLEAHLRWRRSFRDVRRACLATSISTDCRELVDADIRRLVVAPMSAIAGPYQLQPVLVGFEDLNPSCLLDASIATHLMLDGRAVLPVQHMGRLAVAVQDEAGSLGHHAILSQGFDLAQQAQTRR